MNLLSKQAARLQFIKNSDESSINKSMDLAFNTTGVVSASLDVTVLHVKFDALSIFLDFGGPCGQD